MSSEVTSTTGAPCERPLQVEATLDRLMAEAPGRRLLFEKLGFDLSRSSQQSLDSVCRDHHLDARTVAAVLDACCAVCSAVRPRVVELMDLSELCDHLEGSHAEFRQELARLGGMIQQVVEQTAPGGPVPSAICERFAALRRILTLHLREEAEVFFPLIRQLDNRRLAGSGALDLLRGPLAEMKEQHAEVDEALAELEALVERESGQAPDEPRWRTLGALLQKLQEALHGQIYQENQILFRRVLALLSGNP